MKPVQGYEDNLKLMRAWLLDKKNVATYDNIDKCIERALDTGSHSAFACFLLANSFSSRMLFRKLFLKHLDAYIEKNKKNPCNIKNVMNEFVIWKKNFLLDPYYCPEISDTGDQSIMEEQWGNQRLKWIADQPEIPKRDSIIQMALQLQIGLDETNRLLMAAGKNTLYLTSPLDICATYYLEKDKDSDRDPKDIMIHFKEDLNDLILNCDDSWKIIQGGYRIKAIRDISELTYAESVVLNQTLKIQDLDTEVDVKMIDKEISYLVRDDKGTEIPFSIKTIEKKKKIGIKIECPAYDHHILWDPTAKNNKWKCLMPYHIQVKKDKLSEGNNQDIDNFISSIKEGEPCFDSGPTEFVTNFFNHQLDQSIDKYIDEIVNNMQVIGNRRYGFLRKVEQCIDNVSRYEKNIKNYPYFYDYQNGEFIRLRELFRADEGDYIFEMDCDVSSHHLSRKSKIYLLTQIIDKHPIYEPGYEDREKRRADKYSSVNRLLYGREIVSDDENKAKGYYQEVPGKENLVRFACAAGAEDEIGSLLQYAGYWDRDYFNEQNLSQYETLDWTDYMIIYIRRYRDKLLERWSDAKGQSVLEYSNMYRSQFPFYLLVCEITKHLQYLISSCVRNVSLKYIAYTELPQYFICKTQDLNEIESEYNNAMMKLLLEDME